MSIYLSSMDRQISAGVGQLSILRLDYLIVLCCIWWWFKKYTVKGNSVPPTAPCTWEYILVRLLLLNILGCGQNVLLGGVRRLQSVLLEHPGYRQFVVSYCIALQCNLFQCNSKAWKALQCLAMHCSAAWIALQCLAMHCSAMQRHKKHCNALQCTIVQCKGMKSIAIPCNAPHCNVKLIITVYFVRIRFNLFLLRKSYNFPCIVKYSPLPIVKLS